MKQFVKEYLQRNWPQLLAISLIYFVCGAQILLLCLLWGHLLTIGIERTMKLNFKHDLAELRKLATEAQPHQEAFDLLKQQLDVEQVQRIGAEYALMQLRLLCGLPVASTDASEVGERIEYLKRHQWPACELMQSETLLKNGDMTLGMRCDQKAGIGLWSNLPTGTCLRVENARLYIEGDGRLLTVRVQIQPPREAQPSLTPPTTPEQCAAAWATPTPDTEAAVLRDPSGAPAIIQGIDQQIVGANRCRYIERERDRVRLQLLLLNQELEALLQAAAVTPEGDAK